MTKTPQLRWLWLTIFIVILDQACKYYIVRTFSYNVSTAVLPILNIFLDHNTGASFGMLGNASGWQRWLFIGIATIVSIIILFWLSRLSRQENLIACALALLLGGALGNLYDRVTLGYVVDFINLHIGDLYFPAYFNIADAAINLAVVVWIISLFKTKKHHKK